MERLYFIDRLRFIAIVILIFFHSALIFASESNFHVKNKELSGVIEEFIYFLHGWRLALLFFISGVGTSIALQFRNKRQYIKERFKRLFIPLLFGVIVVVPPQIYFERISQGFEYETYFSFWIQSFSTGIYPYGNVSWHHLWFVAYLLIYSVLSVPLFFLVKNHNLKQLNKFAEKWGVLLWAIPLALILALLKPYSIGVQNIVNDLAMFTFYWLVFLSGFVIHNKSYWNYFENKLSIILLLTIMFTVATYYIRDDYSDMPKVGTLYFLYSFVRGCSAWLWVLTLLAVGKKYLNRSGKHLSLLNESVYPLYILHQTVIICIGYYVVQTNWSIITKLLIIVAVTFIICWTMFLLLRKTRLTRLLFGMKH